MTISEKEVFRAESAVSFMKEMLPDFLKAFNQKVTAIDRENVVNITAKVCVCLADALIAELEGGE